MRKISELITVFAILILTSILGVGTASAIPPAPTMENPVVDTTGTLTQEEKSAISKAVDNRPSRPDDAQIAIAFINSLDGDTVENVAMNYATKWGIGVKDKNNGVLLLVAKNDRKIRIEVADGASGSLTDSDSSQIIEETAIPLLKEGKWAKALEESARAIRGKLDGVVYLEDYDSKASASGIFGIFLMIFSFLLFVGALILLWCVISSYVRYRARVARHVAEAPEMIRELEEQIVSLIDQKSAATTKLVDFQEELRNVSSTKTWVKDWSDKVELAERARSEFISAVKSFEREKNSYYKRVAQKLVGSSESISTSNKRELDILGPVALAAAVSLASSNRSDRIARESYSSSSSGFSSGGSSFGGGGGFSGGGASGSW